MKSREIARQYADIINTTPYNPQSAKVIDFMSEHRDGIQAKNNSLAPVAIVIPAHNEARLLPRCLAGINNAVLSSDQQTTVIMVDNASTDGTSEIAEFFGATVVRETTKGIGQARQTGLLATHPANELILTSDSDSLVPDNWIEAHQKALLDPTVSFSCGGIQLLIDQHIPIRRRIGFYFYLIGRGIVQKSKSFLSSRYLPANGANSAFRRSEALAIGGYRARLAAMEDYFIMLDLIEKFRTKTARAEASVITSARRILQSGIVHYAKMRVQDNLKLLRDQPSEPDTYDDYRHV